MMGRSDMDKHENKFLIILIAVLLSIVVSPILREMGDKIGLILSTILVIAVPFASIYAFSGRRKVLIVLILLAC
jgi:hypothetical protein